MYLAFSLFGTEIRWLDVVDIAVVSFLIYQFLLIIRGTGAVQVGLGLLFVVLTFFVSQWFELRTLHWILTKIFPYLVFIVIILFQHEIRKAVSVLGQSPFVRFFSKSVEGQPLDEIILAVTAMASKRTGALVVLEREVGLKNYIEGGVTVDARVSYDLMMSIFNTASPLHDGAVIVQGDRISAAGCFLPLTTNPYLARELGSRHRAAIGLTEETDAVVVVVSEETGKISLVFNEVMISDLDGPQLKQRISEYLARDRGAMARKILRKNVETSL